MTPIRTETLPQPAAVLGTAGLVPFIVLAVQVVTGGLFPNSWMEAALYALLIYGAVVLSFLGGIQWGLAVISADRSDAWRRYGFSVLPPMVAWLAVWWNGPEGLVLLAVGIAVWAAYELWSTGLGEAPQWYGRLRLILSLIAVLCLGASAKYGPF